MVTTTLRSPQEVLLQRIIGIVALYTVVVVIAALVLPGAKLVTIVAVCKACSLAVLIGTSGELAFGVTKSSGRVVRYGNFTILIVTTLIFFMVLIHVFKAAGVSLRIEGSPPWQVAAVGGVVVWIYERTHYFSVFPILAYALLNLYVMSAANRYSDQDRLQVTMHFWLNSVPCCVPLIWVMLIGLAKGAGDEPELFVGGGMSIIILLSSILAKAVDVFFGQPNRQIASGGG